MIDEKRIEELVREAIRSLSISDKEIKPAANSIPKVSLGDYPLGIKKQNLIKTATGKSLQELTLEGVLNGQVNKDDLKISPETLELQAQIAEQAGRIQVARNFRRAAELNAIPDERVLQIYNALRPYRSTKEELLDIASELETKYQAVLNAAHVREAAEVYESRGVLRRE